MNVILDIPDEALKGFKALAKEKRMSRKSYMELLLISSFEDKKVYIKANSRPIEERPATKAPGTKENTLSDYLKKRQKLKQ